MVTALMPMSLSTWPPTTMILPSASCVSPAQNKFSGGLTLVKVFVEGSHNTALTAISSALSHARTLPVGNTFTCTGTNGQEAVVLHWPTTAGSVERALTTALPPVEALMPVETLGCTHL